jgi:flagellin-like protein
MKTLKRGERRGVSPVIATLLLIVIAVAAAVLVYMWTVGYATQMRPTTPETGERLKIEAGKLYRETADSSHVNATLLVRNVGGSPVYLKSAYLLTTAQDVEKRTEDICVAEVTTGPARAQFKAELTPLEPGKVYNVTMRFADAWLGAAGRTYIVRIVTSLGNEFAIEAKLLPTP